MRHTIIIHNHHAGRMFRAQAAQERRHGLQILTIGQLAARLAGGFKQPIDALTLKDVLNDLIDDPSIRLDALQDIKSLPGFRRALAATLLKAWDADIDFSARARECAQPDKKRRLKELARLEDAVLDRLRHSHPALHRPADLVSAALDRITLTSRLFGMIEIQGHTELAPVWRPLLHALSGETELRWIAGPRDVPAWVKADKLRVDDCEAEAPAIGLESCANPHHEVLEALRWARELMAEQSVKPQDIAIATASPAAWDDHVMALADASGLDVHFVHHRPVLSRPEGQVAAALAEVLLQGFSHRRLVRLVRLLRKLNPRFRSLPHDWWKVLPEQAPLLDATRWRQALEEAGPEAFSDGGDHAPLLRELIDTLAMGKDSASTIGKQLLSGYSRDIWHRALLEGPPAALDVTLKSLRMPDGIAPESAIIWAPADALASAPRPYVRLIGFTANGWPRRAHEDPLLPEHIIPADELDPLPVHEADRRDFETIRRTISKALVCTYARRNAEGRASGKSPLYQELQRELESAGKQECERYQSRIPAHAFSSSDRLFARPDEFSGLPIARSALGCWKNWGKADITAHDGLLRADHPLVIAAAGRCQSSTSLTRLLCDPLGYLWRYGFRWSAPEDIEEPLELDALAFGSLLHELLDKAVTRLERECRGGFTKASDSERQSALDRAGREVSERWEAECPIPPPFIWQRTLHEGRRLASSALCFAETPLDAQQSWTEVPFGTDGRYTKPDPVSIPWDEHVEVVIPATDIRINGKIDRLDLSGDRTVARVTDYKSGNPPQKPPILKQGGELQRCLYAYAVKALIPEVRTIETRLLYLKADPARVFALATPEETLETLTCFIIKAKQLFIAGKTLPGPGAKDEYNDLAFALPAARTTYFERKKANIDEHLGKVAPLWEMD